MKPPFAYYGGKSGMAAQIIRLMPPHRVYIEPFFGGGSVFFAKTPVAHEIINDADGEVVNFFRVLRERPEDLERVCALTPHARDEYESTNLDDPCDDEVERARRFWVRITQSFSQVARQSTGWSLTVAANGNRALRMLRNTGRFADAAIRLSSASIENCDAAELVRRMAKTSDTVVYADPPYLMSTRSTQGPKSQDYRVDMGDEASHENLADALLNTPATVILSGYHSPLYDRLYADWDRIDVPRHCASSNARTTQRRQRIDVLWSNRPLNRGQLDFGASA